MYDERDADNPSKPLPSPLPLGEGTCRRGLTRLSVFKRGEEKEGNFFIFTKIVLLDLVKH